MWPDEVVVLALLGEPAAGIGQAFEDFLVQTFVTQAAVNDSMKQFCCGCPGSM